MVLKRKILIVEDEKELVKLITFHMAIAGYDVLSAKNGIEALEVCETQKPALIILDIMLPRIDGWEVCRRLKLNPQTRHIPIIMLSALSEIEDKLKGFDLGTDDYVTKPFSPRELVVRVKRVLARSENKESVLKTIRIGSLEIDKENFEIKRNDQQITFTEKERGMLKLFINNPGIVLSHSEILDAVWGQDTIVEYGNIDVHIRHLREKIEKDPEEPQVIKTVKGEGYKFDFS
ncbi:MAG: response regulator transcription factor [Candidatus Omnitrophota bacterium]|jgi:two-component system alkaline phosphatase synthesis response regulator PhoP